MQSSDPNVVARSCGDGGIRSYCLMAAVSVFQNEESWSWRVMRLHSSVSVCNATDRTLTNGYLIPLN